MLKIATDFQGAHRPFLEFEKFRPPNMKTYLYIDVRNVILMVLKQEFYILNGLRVEITHEISTRAQNFKDPNFLKYLNLGKNILDTCFYDGF